MITITLIFAVLMISASFVMLTPNHAIAQGSDVSPDGEETGKDGEHERKSCPFKNKATTIDYIPNT